MDRKVMSILFSVSCIDAYLKAQQEYFNFINEYRELVDLGRGFSYPLGQNQSEHEIGIFTRGWNAAIEWMITEQKEENNI